MLSLNVFDTAECYAKFWHRKSIQIICAYKYLYIQINTQLNYNKLWNCLSFHNKRVRNVVFLHNVRFRMKLLHTNELGTTPWHRVYTTGVIPSPRIPSAMVVTTIISIVIRQRFKHCWSKEHNQRSDWPCKPIMRDERHNQQVTLACEDAVQPTLG